MRLDPATAQRIETEIADIADSLQSERASLDHAVQGLVGGSWTGLASDAFGAGWQEWSEGAGTVIGALHAMGRLIGEARVEVVTNDGSVADAHRSLHSRLGPS